MKAATVIISRCMILFMICFVMCKSPSDKNKTRVSAGTPVAVLISSEK
jgi:hypothetical protein